MDMTTKDALRAAYEAGIEVREIGHRMGEVQTADGAVPVALDAAGNTVVQREAFGLLEEMRAGPRRRKGTSRHHELDSFIAYVNRFKPAQAVVFADQEKFTATAVLDYHPAGTDPTDAGWAGHRAVYECPRSQAWKEWTALDGKDQRQDAFADFIEAHLEDLTSGAKGEYPAPTEVLQMARDLRVHTAGRFERKVDPRTGESSMVCKTEHDASSTHIPRAFLVGLPVFEGGDAYRIECRIRFRLQEGVPIFTFIMHRRADVERDAFGAVRTKVAAETSLPVFAGAPES